MKISVIPGRVFLRKLKQLVKKYPNIRQDVEQFIGHLQAGETPGDQIPHVGYPVYKVRLSNRDAQRGARGGFRIVYYIHLPNMILLVTLYSKTEQENIAPEDLRRIIEEELGNMNT